MCPEYCVETTTQNMEGYTFTMENSDRFEGKKNLELHQDSL